MSQMKNAWLSEEMMTLKQQMAALLKTKQMTNTSSNLQKESTSNPPPSTIDRIPSTTPGAEPPRDARDSGSARSHSTHLETSSSDRPEMVTYMDPQTVPSYMSVKCTRRTLRMPKFHARTARTTVPK